MGTCGGEDPGTGRLGDLDSEGAHPTGATMDQYRLADPHGESPHYRLVRRAPRERHRRSLFM